MDIRLSDKTLKYEIEAVLKIFFPEVTFRFVDMNEICSEDYIEISAVENICISICMANSKSCESVPLPESESDIEFAACKLLYTMLSKITGKISDWGLLTGIRPVKKINALLEEGLSKDDIRQKMSEKYLLSDEKFRLSYLTAETQSKYIPIKDRASFSLYIGIPFCPSRCSYCSFVSHSIQSSKARKLTDEYTEKLIEEIILTSEIAREMGIHPNTIYIGGGTPTSLKPEQIYIIMDTIAKNFNLSAVFEYTVEAGRADTITEEKLRIIKDGGATRISINPQTLNDEVLVEIGRKHTVEQFLNSFDLARKMGFENINTDLIAGLPTDTIGSLKNSLDGIIDLSPESITVHALTLKRAAKISVEKDIYKRSEEIKTMTEYSFRKLTENGYFPYYLYRQKNTIGNQENVGYAKKGYENAYNIYIMEEIQTIIACGAGASTKVYEPETGKLTRIFNYKYPYEYITNFSEIIARKDRLRGLLRGMNGGNHDN
jgi:oxygen-independent coproporphyrinogen-3 oxidase